ncbi:MinD/ParA family protein [Virgibacillus sp. NKC19-16]|uniref:MinD/ParA family protein n=1 Tax=Virgibacillus salidurans TaxID=2831673 RepID=UPI001F3A6FAF|nr:MinD/ParA family protein [Virgibacillus sp. NKC19-16]UJL47955.1 MinD/ParA family protein [Virgibacillus sp. NKC19-16]
MYDQASSLRRQVHSKEAKTLAIISGKGGVGKSNIALNFSLELIRQQKKVLLFDLDVGMGNIDILLGLHAEKTIIDMFNEKLSIHEIIEKGPGGLAYIAGGSGLSDFFTMNQGNRDYFFVQYQELTEFYDYILFDMGAGATKDSIFFILASDECMVITTPEPTSITDAYSMVKHVASSQPDIPIYVVMNRSTTSDGKISLERFKNVVDHFLHIDIKMLGIIPEDKTVFTAVRRQIPYVLLNEQSTISKATKQLVRNYTTNTSGVNKIESTSFVQKLKQLLAGR